MEYTYSLSIHKGPLLFCEYLQVLRQELSASILSDVFVLCWMEEADLL